MAVVYRIAAIQAAVAAGQSPVMDEVAAKIESTVRGLAAGHRVTGEYVAGIGSEEIAGKRGVTDRIVFVDHPAAASIEFGHLTRLGEGSEGPRRHVAGLHIFGRAAR